VDKLNITGIEGRGCGWQSAKWPIVDSENVARFWGKVRKDAHGCWEWTGSRMNGRYGQFTYTTRTGQVHIYAHRMAWEITNGPIPAKHYICHTCDNPLCVRPDHLFAGTQFDNMRDASRKGRLSLPRLRNRATADEVRRRWLAGGVSQRDLAREFGVHEVQIGRWLRTVKGKPYERRQLSPSQEPSRPSSDAPRQLHGKG
jgi:hypothetical protein